MTQLEPLRIGMTCHPTYGGSGAVAVELAQALVARGHEVHVISYAPPFRLEAGGGVQLHEVAVPTYPLFKFPPYDMALASKLAEVAADFRLQILHAHYAIPHSMAAYLAREILGDDTLGVVTTLHGTDITLVGADPSYRPATTFALRKSDAVTAVSRFLSLETQRKICGACRIEVIHNFVDTTRYEPAPRSPVRLRFAKPDEWLLVHTSNFRPVKRIGDVVQIFAEVSRALPAKLLMIGDGPDRPLAERMAKELGLQKRIVFTGALPDAAELTAQADAFLLPSDGESFGLAALEALACGVPVVGSRAGGLPEVFEDGVEGILEEVGQTRAMGQRLVALLGDPKRLEATKLAARARATQLFRTESVVPQYEQVYRDVIARRQHRPESKYLEAP